jgi:hypothetical protein
MRRFTSLLIVMLLFTGSIWSQTIGPNLSEGFESGVIPDNWTVINLDGGTQEWVAQTSNPNSGTYAARVRYETSSLDNDDWLITPALWVTSATTDEISFWMRTFSATANDPWEVLISTTDTDPASFTLIDSGTGQLADYEQKTYSLDSYGDAIVYLAVRYIGTYDWYLYVDDFEGPPVVLPDCPKPVDLTATDITTSSAVLGWTPGGDESSWNIEWGLAGFTQGDGTLIEGVTENPYSLMGLEANTAYQFYVQADCEGDDVSAWAGPVSFTTVQIPADLPFAEDFETWPNDWSVVNGVQVNQWHVGIDTSFAGAQSLYVSNDGGVTNAYTITSSSVSHVYRDIAFTGEASGYELKFWWKGQGEGASTFFDYMRVFLVETSVLPVAGVQLTEGQVGGTYNLQLEWQEEVLVLPDTLSGSTYRLVFSWRNDGSIGTQPPAAVDNIEINLLQAGVLEGTVTEATRGTIENAHVMAGEYEAFTDENGYYMIENMLPGFYDVTCEADGFIPVTVENVEVVSLQTTTQDFTLGFATIAVNPDSLSETLSPGFTSTQSLTISNDGTDELSWSALIEEIAPTRQQIQIPPVQNNHVSSTENLSWGKAPYANGSKTPMDPILLRGSNAYGFDMFPGNDFIGFDTDDPTAFSFVFPSEYTVFAADFDQNEVFYAIDDDTGNLYTVDIATGTFTFVGPSLAFTDLAFDYTTNTMFGVAYDGVSNSLLYTLNLSTGAYSLIGDCGAGLVISMACDGEGQLYGFDISTDQLVSIDKSTAQKTVVGPVGFDGNFAQSMAWDAESDIIYMAAYDNTLSQGQLRVVDKTTGATTLLGVFPDGAEVCGLGFKTAPDTWLSINPTSGTVLPGESASIEVTFSAGDLIDSTYLANININHNGLETGRGTVAVPVSLTVASTQAPEPPTDFIPEDGADFVNLQPMFSWTNGAGTAQVRFQLNRFTGTQFNPLVYASPWFVGNSINLAELDITLLAKTDYRWQVFAKNAAGEVTSGFLFFQTVGSGTIAGVVTESFEGQPLQGVSITVDEFRFSAETDENGLYNIPNVPEGEYTITASFEGYIEQTQTAIVEHEQTSFASFVLDLFLTPPSGLQAEVQDIFDVQLSWNSPGGVELVEFLYDDGIRTAQLGSQTGTVNTVLGSKHDTPATLNEVSWLLSDDPAGGGPHATVQFYIFGLQPNGLPDGTNVLYTANLTNVDGVFNTHILPEPIDAPNGFFLGVAYNGFVGIGTDDGIGEPYEFQPNTHYFTGDYTTNEWSTWESFNFQVNGMIRAFGVPGAVASYVTEHQQVIETRSQINDQKFELRPSAEPSLQEFPTWKTLTGNQSRGLTGYNIYKDDALLLYTTDTTYLDQDLEPGTYSYKITAVYDEGESDPTTPKEVSILAPPTLLSAEQVGDEIQLAWESNFVGKGMLANQETSASVSALNYIDLSGKEKRHQAPYIKPQGVRQGGDLIEDAFEITEVPFMVTGTTTGYTNDYDEECTASGSTAPDVVYEYTPTESTFLNIDMCGSSYDTKIYVYENTYTPGEPYACNDDYYDVGDPCGSYVSAIFGMAVTGGNTYYIVVDGYGTANGEYMMDITEGEPPCTVECPPGALQESEACGDDLNGGCNMDVPAFEPIAMGDVICGTVWADAGSRDTDWFELEITTPMQVTFSVTAEFPSAIGLLEQFEPGVPGCDNITGNVSPFALGEDCEAASVEVLLVPGTYYFFVSASVFEDYPCGSSNNYVAELTGEEVFVPFFTVYKDGEALADVYNASYTDMAIMPGTEYCYTVTETVNEDPLETGFSNEICVEVPLYGLLSVDPESIFEEHIPAPQVTTQSITVTNDGDGPMEFAVGVELIENKRDSEEYCTGGPTSTFDSNVTLVLLDGEESGINHVGCPGVTGLEDLTALVADLKPGEEYTVTVEWGTCGGNYGNAATVWIDWNGDQTFTTDEIVGTWSGTPTVLQNYTFTVPANAVPGATRMRVMQQEGGTLPLDPCASYTWGSKMDFGIEVIDTRWVKTEPEAGMLNPGESITLDVIFNSTDLDFGIFNANLNFSTNNPFATQPEVVVPVELVTDADLGMISGYVTDLLGSRGPVQGVSITADEFRASFSTVTDAEGFYELVVPAGVYTVTAEKEGYATQTVEGVTVILDETTTVDFVLDILGPTLLYAEGGVGLIEIGWEGNPLFGQKRAGSLGEISTAAVQPMKSIAEKQPYRPEVKVPISTVSRATGDDCSDPIVISSFPYTDNNTTCGRGNNYEETCLGNYDGGEDIVYEFTLTELTKIGIDLATTATWTGVLVTSECPIAMDCETFITGSLGPKYLEATLDAGTYYIMIDTWPSPNCIPEFTLTIEVIEECVLECPPGAISEGEVCLEDEAIDDFNGGCNSVPAVFSSIADGDVICGTASTFSFDGSNFRDTDWYEIVLDEPKTITWSVTAEFPSLVFIVDGTNGCEQQLTVGSALADPCETATVTATVPPGTYWMIALPSVFEGYPCGTSNTYIAEFTYEEAFLPYFNIHRDGEFLAQSYGNSYTDMDIEPGIEYCYTVTQVPQEGFETPESNELCASMFCSDACEYSMVLTDSFGDGWNGAAVTFIQDGSELGTFTLTDGGSGTASVALCDGLETSVVWTEGFFDEECAFELYDAEGNLIYSFDVGDAPAAGEFFNFTSECPEMPEQLIVMEEGWNAWSSYINPDVRMGMDELMAPVLDDMIVTQYFFELFYPEFGINNMSAFTNNHGYLTKMSASATLPIVGMMADPMVDLAAGWNLLPVLQECPIAAADVFANMAGFEIAWDPMGNGIYYPDGELYTLQTLMPGKAYWVKVAEQGSYTYPGCDEKSNVPGNAASIRAANTTNWNDVNYNPVNHAVVLSTEAAAALQTGDLIGAFTADGMLAGLSEATGQAIGLQLYGDDFVTMGKDGFTEGESITYRVYRPATTEEFEVEATYSTSAPNADGLFDINGVSVVTDLKLAPTSVGASLMNGLSIYPNPSSGVFNIAVSNLDQDVKYVVSNAQGQEVYSGNLSESQILDLSSEPKGVYLIRFINNDVLGVKKLIIK